MSGFVRAVAAWVALAVASGAAAQAVSPGITGAELLANAATNVDLSTGGHSVGASGFAATATAYCTVGLCFLLVIAVRWRAYLWRTDAAANTF